MSTQVKDITLRARPDILALKPYSSARSLYGEGEGFAFLDANECPFAPFPGGEGLNRYPEQQPGALIGALRGLYDVSSRNMVACRGADEAIDVLIRAFCASGADNIIVTPPTFVMYRQAAALQGAEVRQAPLRPADFSLDPALVERCADENTKIVFLCSPNNPTGNLMEEAAMLSLCAVFEGRALVVVDETYIEYAARDSLVRRLDEYGNLVILRTLSKAYAAAGIRCGVAIAAAPVIDLMKKVLAPYPLPRPVVSAAVRILTPENRKRIEQKRAQLLASRDALRQRLSALPEIEKIYPSDANFLLVKTADAAAFTEKCVAAGVIARSQSHVPGLENCVRLSIGTDEEMERLMAALAGVAGAADRRGKSERVSSVSRVTKETAVSVAVDLDRENPVSISTGVGFYDHMLEQIARHGGFSLTLECAGDLHIDPHHTIEDCAIALGQALREALGAKQGIGRYGFTVPMDEAQASCVLDLGGRFYLDFAPRFPESRVGGMPTDMVRHVFYSLAENLGANLHMEVRGENTHHMVEGCFKAFGRALRQAIRREGEALPSTKGVL